MINDEILKELEGKILNLRDINELIAIEALTRANEIVKLINKLIDAGKGNSTDLYTKAADAYIMAAKKVPKEYIDMVEFPSNYWHLRAKEEKLKISESVKTEKYNAKLHTEKLSPSAFAITLTEPWVGHGYQLPKQKT